MDQPKGTKGEAREGVEETTKDTTMVLWDMFPRENLTKGETTKESHSQNKNNQRSKCLVSSTSTP